MSALTHNTANSPNTAKHALAGVQNNSQQYYLTCAICNSSVLIRVPPTASVTDCRELLRKAIDAHLAKEPVHA